MKRLDQKFINVFKNLGRLGPDLINQIDVPIRSHNPQKSSNSLSKRHISLQKQLIPVIAMPQPTSSAKVSAGKAKEVVEEVVEKVVEKVVEGVTEEAFTRVSRSGRVIKNPRKM